MKKQRKNQKRKTTVIKTETAPSEITPMNSTVRIMIDPSCALTASTGYGLKTAAYLRSLWSRPERRSRKIINNIIAGAKDFLPLLRRHSLNIALITTVIALIAFLAFITWLHLTSAHNITIKQAREAYFEQMNKEQSTDAAQRAWKRLQSKHGYPAAVIYEPGKTPYFINKSGQRCRFV
jgi:hypothetical protein